MLQRQVRTGLSPETQTRRYGRSGNLAYQHTTAANQAWQYSFVTHAGGAKSNVLLSALDSSSVQWLFIFNGDLGRRSETRGGQPFARYWYDALGRTSGVNKVPGTMTFGPNRCQYDPDGQMADPCEAASPRLVFHGPNVLGTVAPTTSDWRFIHGPGTDDPIIGLYRATGAPAVEFYWVTDGGGRQLAVATPDGSLNFTQINQLQVSGGAYAGGTSNSYGFGASRFGTPDIPTMSFFRNRVYDQESGRFTQEDPIGVGGGLNLYQYAGNSPVTFTDPFGLWPPKVHDDLIRRALAGRATVDQIARLQNVSRSFDSGTEAPFGDTQGAHRSYMHAMRAPGQSAADAKEMTARFVSSMVARGQAAFAQGDIEGAMSFAGVAMHAQMDATSPYHTDANGDPIEWRGMGSVSSLWQHKGEVLDKPSDAQIDRSNAALRAIWDRIFGGPR